MSTSRYKTTPQDVTYKLLFYDGRWILDDFFFDYDDGERVVESEEMKWFIDYYGEPDADASQDAAEKPSATKPREATPAKDTKTK